MLLWVPGSRHYASSLGSSFAELMWVKSGTQKPDEKRHASMCHAIQPVAGIRAAFNLNA
jgi:hypothetical protein